jgi:hypothetical protein
MIIKRPFARWTRVFQRLPPVTTVRWMQSEKTERGALGRECTRAEGCNRRPGAHVADEPTRVVVGSGDPVTVCLASMGRRDGGWVCSELQMAEDLADHCALRDDGDEPQGPVLTPRAVHHIQCKHPLE